MSWDAFSNVVIETDKRSRKQVIVGKGKEEFEQAADEVVKEAGIVDCLLRIGGLDVDICGYMLEVATGKSVWTRERWSSEYVKTVNKLADWDFEVSEENLWAYLSAKKFLEICAKLDLSITFTY